MADEPRPVKRAVKLGGAGGLVEKRDATGTAPPVDVRATPVPAAPEWQRGVIDAPLVGRTATLADPLTTSLLAEITRRSTVEMSPAELAEARRRAEAASDDDDDASRDPAAKR